MTKYTPTSDMQKDHYQSDDAFSEARVEVRLLVDVLRASILDRLQRNFLLGPTAL